jgi:hypothetical protein
MNEEVTKWRDKVKGAGILQKYATDWDRFVSGGMLQVR